MRAALKTFFPGIKHALEFNDEEPEDDDEAYQNLEYQKDPPLRVHYNYFQKSEFLVLLISTTHCKRRLKKSEALGGVIGKLSRIVALSHHSTIFKEM